MIKRTNKYKKINTSDNAQRCTRCILPDNFRNISFNDKGECSFCDAHDKEIAYFQRYDLAKEMFLKKVEKDKGKYKYDCAVGLSGGKDSTYVLYKMLDLGLNVLAITIDNGWQDKIAKENIKKIVENLGVDHITLGIEKPLIYKLYAGATKNFGWPCITCSYLGLGVAQKYCFDHKIPVLVHGRARNQMVRELGKLSQDSYLPYYGIEYREYDFEDHMRVIEKQSKALHKIIKILLPNKTERDEFTEKYLIDHKKCREAGFAPRFASQFLMEDYDEEKVRKFHEEKVLQGKKMHKRDHSDCMASEAFMHIYKKSFGWSLMELELSLDIREGKISRDEALKKISEEKCAFEVPDKSFRLMEEKLGVHRDKILSWLPVARKNIEKYRKFSKFKNRIFPRQIMK